MRACVCACVCISYITIFRYLYHLDNQTCPVYEDHLDIQTCPVYKYHLFSFPIISVHYIWIALFRLIGYNDHVLSILILVWLAEHYCIVFLIFKLTYNRYV